LDSNPNERELLLGKSFMPKLVTGKEHGGKKGKKVYVEDREKRRHFFMGVF
jgi:hypothetical protein